MLALPTGAWGEAPVKGEGAPAPADWRDAGAVDHVFTHFALNLRLLRASAVGRDTGDIWWPVDRIGDAGLPTLFARLAERAAGEAA
mgnify:CR=1 FL=1